jgi:hypothetical protein
MFYESTLEKKSLKLRDAVWPTQRNEEPVKRGTFPGALGNQS